MYAARVHGARDIRYESVPDPEPAPDEVVAAVRAVGVCRTDVEIYEQALFHYKEGYAKLPITPGHEWSGEVVAIGREVTRFRVGDRVSGETAIGCMRCRLCLTGHTNVCPARVEVGVINRDGAYADLVCVPEHTAHSIGAIPFDHAACVEPTAVAVWLAKMARISPSDSVLIVGAGSIGLLCLQAARCFGAHTIVVVERNAYRRSLAESLGADTTVDGATESLRDAAQRLTGGDGFDVVIEAAGAPALFEDCVRSTGVLGRLMICGTLGASKPPLDSDYMIAREIEIRATLGGGSAYPDAIRLIEQGRMTPGALIAERRPLHEAGAVLASLADGPVDGVKTLLMPTGEPAR